MKKPVLISAFGWLALICSVMPMTKPIYQLVSGEHLPVTAWPGLMFAFSIPCFIIWAVGSIWWSFQARKAKMWAEAMQKAAAAAGRTATPFPPREASK